MHGKSGFELIQAIRQSPVLNQTPIIATSASVYHLDRQKSLAYGANTFLPKPVEARALFDQLGSLLNLNWVFGECDASRSDSSISSQIEPPPAEILDALMELSDIGDIHEMRVLLEKLAQSDSKYKPFSDELLQLVRAFRVDEIGKALLKHQEILASRMRA